MLVAAPVEGPPPKKRKLATPMTDIARLISTHHQFLPRPFIVCTTPTPHEHVLIGTFVITKAEQLRTTVSALEEEQLQTLGAGASKRKVKRILYNFMWPSVSPSDILCVCETCAWLEFQILQQRPHSSWRGAFIVAQNTPTGLCNYPVRFSLQVFRNTFFRKDT